jgi:hypothetical protein
MQAVTLPKPCSTALGPITFPSQQPLHD